MLAMGTSGLQKIVGSSAALAARPDFRAVANLGALDVLAGGAPALPEAILPYMNQQSNSAPR